MRDPRQIPREIQSPESGVIYRPTRVLGSGGMALACEAISSESGARVALKRVVPDVAWSFEVEAELLGSVRHPNVIDLLEVIRDHNGPFLVLELADTTAAEQCRATAVAESQIARVGSQIASALAHLHAGMPDGTILHRDIKPENIYRYSGTWKLADFGAATRAASPSSIPLAGIPDPWFVPPEISDPGRAKAASELYQQALTHLWLAIGRRPLVSGSHAEVRGAALSGAPQQLALSYRWQCRSLGALVAAALDAIAANRPATAAEVAAELARTAV